MIVFFYCSLAYSFESELVPIELNRILVTKNDVLSLHTKPFNNSPNINKFRIKKGEVISFDKSRTRTLKSSSVLIKARKVELEGVSYGNIEYLSNEKYNAPFLDPNLKYGSDALKSFVFKRGDSFEELHHAPEGS